jgi:hypothetical protein
MSDDFVRCLFLHEPGVVVFAPSCKIGLIVAGVWTYGALICADPDRHSV